MKNSIIYLVFLLFISSLPSCSNTQNIFQSPTFLVSHNIPDKPTFERHSVISDYYMEEAFSLNTLNSNLLGQNKPELTQSIHPFSRYTKPLFSTGFSNSNTINSEICVTDFNYGNYLGGTYFGVQNLEQPFGVINYLTYSYDYDRGPPGTYTWHNNSDENYPKFVRFAPRLNKSIYTIQSIDVRYSRTISSKNVQPIVYAKPKSNKKPLGSTKTSYVAQSSYNYLTKKRNISKTGHYNDPSAPTQYNHPSGNGNSNLRHRTTSNGSSYAPKAPRASSSGSGYRPPRSSGGTGGLPSGGGRSTPTRNNSSSGHAVPKR